MSRLSFGQRLKALFTGVAPKSDFPVPVIGEDLALSLNGDPTNMRQVIQNKPRVLGRVHTYEFKGGTDRQGRRTNFTKPPYDLAEIGRAVDTESYIRQSITKHREQILKEGFTLTGADATMVDYVERRLFEMALATGITTKKWLRNFVTNLITFHTSYLVYRRDGRKSRGKPIKIHGERLEPVAGIFVPDPTTMEVAPDKYGAPKKWKQKLTTASSEPATKEREFKTSDVVSCTMDQKSGYSFGTPYILPVLDDARAWRRLEEIALILSSKEAFPLYHYKIGTETQPAQYYEGGGSEVDEVASQVENMPLQGNIITSERHEIKLISREGSALDLVPYLEYFEKRVMGGLRLSDQDLGRGGSVNKATSQTINKALQDAAKDYQDVLSDCLTFGPILSLTLEGGFDVTHTNMVKFSFQSIDKEEERAHQNHGSQLCLNNQITCAEFREDYLGKRPMSQEEMRDTTREHDAEVDERQIRLSAAVAPKPASTSSSSTAKKSTSTNKKTVANRTRPSNQNGSVTKSRVRANDYVRLIDSSVTDVKTRIMEMVRQETIPTELEIKEVFTQFVEDSVKFSRSYILDQLSDGVDHAVIEYGRVNPDAELPEYEIGRRQVERFFVNFVKKSFWKVVNPFMDSTCRCFSADTDNNRAPYQAIGAMEAFRKSISRLALDQLDTARIFAFAKYAKQLGYNSIGLGNENEVRKEIDISSLRYSDLIPELNQDSQNLVFVPNNENRNGTHESSDI